MTASLWRTLVRLALASSLVLAAACTPDPPTTVVQKGDDSGGGDDYCPPPCSLDGTPPAPWDSLTWEITEIDVGNPTHPAGIQSRMIRKPNGDIHIAYLESGEPRPSCDIAAFGGGPAPVPFYDLKVATLLNGATDWTIESISLLGLDEPGHATARYGIDATLNNAGQMVIVLAAGGVSLFQCGSTDVVVCTQGGTWNCQAQVPDSTGCCPERDTCTLPGLECCDAMQNACRTGSTVGAWAAIAAAETGSTIGISYVDTHNAAVQDAQDNQGLEFTEGGASSGIRPWSGNGKYAALAYDGTTPVIAFTHFHHGGLSILRRPAVASTGNDWLEPDVASRIDVWDG